MPFIRDELQTQLNHYLDTKTREELLDDLIQHNCLDFFVNKAYTRESDYLYGTVSQFSHIGYGFITGEDRQSYFIFWKNIDMKGFKTLDAGNKVKFKARQRPRGTEAYDAVRLPDDFVLHTTWDSHPMCDK